MKPLWRVDLKWLVGIAFVLCAVVAALAYSLYRLTEYETATGTTAAVIESLAEAGLDEDLHAKLQEAARANPEAEVQAGDVVLPLLGKEILGLSREEVLRKAAASLADKIYYEGVDAAETYFRGVRDAEETPEGPPPQGSPPEQGASPDEEESLPLAPLDVFTESSHQKVRFFLLGTSLGALALLGVLALLGRGFGRMGAPGLAMAVAVGPLAVAFQVMRSVFDEMRNDEGGVFPAAAGALYPAMDDLARLFTILAGVGVGLVLAAVVGNLGLSLWRRVRARRAEPGEALEDRDSQGETEGIRDISEQTAGGPKGISQL